MLYIIIYSTHIYFLHPHFFSYVKLGGLSYQLDFDLLGLSVVEQLFDH